MRRRTVHLAFGAVALGFVVFSVYQGVRFREAQQVNAAVAGARETGTANARTASTSTASTSTASTSTAGTSTAGTSTAGTSTAGTLPEARFVQAMAIAKSGDYDGALKAYKALGRDAPPALAAAALYNAGNLQLRAALKEGSDAAVRALPLIELSKQSYRAVLRIDPQNWDARYNLERALWLAPEIEEASVDRIRRDTEDRVLSTLQSTRADLP